MLEGKEGKHLLKNGKKIIPPATKKYAKKIVPVHYKRTPYMKGDKTQLRTPQIRPYPLQEKFKILFLGGYVYDVTNSK